jgi:hypothetical protein
MRIRRAKVSFVLLLLLAGIGMYSAAWAFDWPPKVPHIEIPFVTPAVNQAVKGGGNILTGTATILEGGAKTLTGNPEGPKILERGTQQVGQGIMQGAPAAITVVTPVIGAAIILAPDTTKFIYEVSQKWRGHPDCNPDEQIARLMTVPKKTLGDFDRLAGLFSTPGKYLSSVFNGPDGWEPTGCDAVGVGVPVRDAQNSTDGIWTVDVAIQELDVQTHKAPPGRYVRLEIKPGSPASRSANQHPPTPNDLIGFAGPMIWDKDKDGEHPYGHMEIHPQAEIRFLQKPAPSPPPVPPAVTPPAAPPERTGTPPPGEAPALPVIYVVVRGDSLSKIAERSYGRQVWQKIYAANRGQIKDPDLIYPGQSFRLPRPSHRVLSN